MVRIDVIGYRTFSPGVKAAVFHMFIFNSPSSLYFIAEFKYAGISVTDAFAAYDLFNIYGTTNYEIRLGCLQP